MRKKLSARRTVRGARYDEPVSQTTTVAAPNEGSERQWVVSARTAFSERVLRRRLLGEQVRFGLWGWLLPLLVALVGGLLRFVRLGEPDTLVFDETYYVKDAYSYLLSGYEREWPEEADDSFNAGNPGVILGTADYVVHPPVGTFRP